jgi:hypothetical protein
MLTCGCIASVRLSIPLVFLSWIRVRVTDPGCHRRHRIGSTRIAGLEQMKSRVTPAQT